MEGAPKPVVESNENVESPEAWRTLKQEAPTRATEILEGQGIEIHPDPNDTEALDQILDKLPTLKNELSFIDGNPKNGVRNENRFVVEKLTEFELYVERLKAANTNKNPFQEERPTGTS